MVQLLSKQTNKVTSLEAENSKLKSQIMYLTTLMTSEVKAKEKERETSSKLKTQLAYMVDVLQKTSKAKLEAESKYDILKKEMDQAKPSDSLQPQSGKFITEITYMVDLLTSKNNAVKSLTSEKTKQETEMLYLVTLLQKSKAENEKLMEDHEAQLKEHEAQQKEIAEVHAKFAEYNGQKPAAPGSDVSSSKLLQMMKREVNYLVD